jgi:hypothetical protein
MSIKTLQTFGLGQTPTQGSGIVTQPSQQTSIADVSNIRYPRTFILNNGFLLLSHSTTTAGIALSDLALALITLEPTLTWPPVIITQPAPQVVTHPTPATFSFIVTSEVAVSYQWYVSTDNGVTFNPISAAGTPNYSGFTTFQLTIGTTATSMNGYLYQCTAQNANPNIVTSNSALLTVN